MLNVLASRNLGQGQSSSNVRDPRLVLTWVAAGSMPLSLASSIESRSDRNSDACTEHQTEGDAGTT